MEYAITEAYFSPLYSLIIIYKYSALLALVRAFIKLFITCVRVRQESLFLNEHL